MEPSSDDMSRQTSSRAESSSGSSGSGDSDDEDEESKASAKFPSLRKSHDSELVNYARPSTNPKQRKILDDDDDDGGPPLETGHAMIDPIDVGEYSQDISQFINEPRRRYSKSEHVFNWSRDDDLDNDYIEEGADADEIERVSRIV